MSDSKIINLNDDNFEKNVIKKNSVILVDFWAEWCRPCKMLIPILEDLSKEYFNKIKICKVNVEQNHKLSKKYLIKSIPTLILFKNGIVKDTRIGSISKLQLKEFFNIYI
ncbi:thioredoxin [Buchnera aphidicola (Ceratoglyphina bambusae)]|uniref:thioredoxin n=1 Tax=Buchnera aphidicola TaxID=9 RepID=UPI0031B86851